MGRNCRLPFFGFLLFLVTLGHESHAAKTGDSRTGGAALVELSPFMAPVARRDGRITPTPVTPVLRLADAETTDEVCWLTPRILDAFVNVLYRDPIPGSSHGKLNLVKMRKTLTDAINTALGRPLIAGLDLVPWVKSDSSPDSDAGMVRCDF